jgi:hypothetical protein
VEKKKLKEYRINPNPYLDLKEDLIKKNKSGKSFYQNFWLVEIYLFKVHNHTP